MQGLHQALTWTEAVVRVIFVTGADTGAVFATGRVTSRARGAMFVTGPVTTRAHGCRWPDRRADGEAPAAVRLLAQDEAIDVLGVPDQEVTICHVVHPRCSVFTRAHGCRHEVSLAGSLSNWGLAGSQWSLTTRCNYWRLSSIEFSDSTRDRSLSHCHKHNAPCEIRKFTTCS